MNNAADSPLDSPLEKAKKQSERLNLIGIGPKLAATEKGGRQPVGVIV